jgi:hypothetical protein
MYDMKPAHISGIKRGLAMNSKDEDIRDLNSGINKFKMGSPTLK